MPWSSGSSWSMCKSVYVQSFTDGGSRLSTWAWACVLHRVFCATWMCECCVHACVRVSVACCMHACMNEAFTPFHWHVHISSFIKTLHGRIKRKLTMRVNFCSFFPHACIPINMFINTFFLRKTSPLLSTFGEKFFGHSSFTTTLVDDFLLTCI